MAQKIKKLKEKVELSGDLATQMFNYIVHKGTYAEVVQIVAQFNEETKDSTEEVEVDEEGKLVEDKQEVTKEDEQKED